MNGLKPYAAWHAQFRDPTLAAGLEALWQAPDHVLQAHTLSEVLPCLARAQALAAQGLCVVGGVQYEAAAAFDSSLHTASPCAAPLAYFLAFPHARIQRVQLAENTEPTADDGLTTEPWLDDLTTPLFNQTFQAVSEAIAQGEFYQINFTTRLRSHLTAGDTWALFLRLYQAQPAQLSLYMSTPGGDVLSLSPELFFEVRGKHLKTSPMKGTQSLGEKADGHTPALQDSEKDRAENVMIVDLLRNDMAKVCEARSVQVQSLFDVMTLPTLAQMTSTITGQLKEGTGVVEVFKALFPCGSVTGAPKHQAMLRIAQWEPAHRGFYCGALGVFNGPDQVRFNVPIRTVQTGGLAQGGPGALMYGVGSGVTWYSQPQAEQAEWAVKTRFLSRATTEFHILETVRLQDGQWQRADDHLQRMRRSAAALGFVWPEQTMPASLKACAALHPVGVHRGRWLLWRDGQFDIQVFPHHDQQAPVSVRVVTWPKPVQPCFIVHKTTHRPHYDAAYALADGDFDVLLCNAEGVLLESSRANVVVQLDGRLYTPVLDESAGLNLLPGVFRQALLRHNTVVEARLQSKDLARAEGIWLVNSLRGWISVHTVNHEGGQWSVSTPAVPELS